MARGEKLKSSIGSFLTDLFDLMALELLWILCSVPVITVGASTTALYSVMLKVARGEPVATFSEFFKSYKENFRNSVFYGLILLAGGAVIVGDFLYAINSEGGTKTLFLIVAGIAAALWLSYFVYVFPLQARFENTFKGTIKNAFLLAFVRPLRTLAMWVIALSPVILYVVLLPPYVNAYIGWAYILFSISLPAYCNSKILRGIFDSLDEAKAEAEKEKAAAEGGEASSEEEQSPSEEDGEWKKFY